MELSKVRDLWILSDTSSMEIFVNGGEETFTSRIYDSMKDLKVKFSSGQRGGRVELYELIV